MRWILFWSFLALLVVLVVCWILASFFGLGALTEQERLGLLGVFTAVGLAVTRLFYTLFKVSLKHQGDGRRGRELKGGEKIPEATPDRIKVADLRGKWKSLTTWEEGGEVRTSEEEIVVKQNGKVFEGEAIRGDFSYKFNGRIEQGGRLIGEWQGKEQELLFGVFLLVYDIDYGKRVAGYWIGEGTHRIFTGEWKWEK